MKLVVSGDKMVAIDGNLRIDAPGDGPVSIQRETRTQDENGRTIIEKERWSLQGEGVLKLVPTGQDRKEGDPQAAAVEGR